MKKKGRAECTIIETTRRLKELAKDCNIDEPEQVKLALANKKWANTTKSTTISAYTAYLRFLNKTWTPPKYIIQEKIYFIPTENEIDQLIASAGKTIATLLQLLKETGASHWLSPNTGATNESGFSALPGGYRNFFGTYFLVGTVGFWWSSTEDNTSSIWTRVVGYSLPAISRQSYEKGSGFSVRCIKD